MKAVLDACVLFPTVLREILADVAVAGLYQPVWTPRIIDEWTRAAARQDAVTGDIARAEAALMTARFPAASVMADEALAAGLDLPDPADAHVVAAAMASGADLIVTANLQDFPRPAMLAAGLRAIHPDAFLTDLWAKDPDPVADAARAAHEKALAMGGEMSFRELMKRARLPRLGKAIAR